MATPASFAYSARTYFCSATLISAQGWTIATTLLIKGTSTANTEVCKRMCAVRAVAEGPKSGAECSNHLDRAETSSRPRFGAFRSKYRASAHQVKYKPYCGIKSTSGLGIF